ncbi:cysteine dioxygenase family protein [Granulicella sp. dw_53]|uniref:cysteine dioxygenase n=1 Tax=Granulicella sp. dw_53 TaxID=2719792 RepID=UPI001BD3E388|nr:cysteine dioxygenase family protein [Granulicella sp. dw_53]
MSDDSMTVLDTHPLHTSVGDFVQGLKELERDYITKDRIAEYMAATPLRAEALKDYVWWRDSLYTRNLIYRDELFEVMTICWSPGQRTAIHTHNGQLGWMTVAQGEVRTHEFHHTSCNAPENQNVVNIDCLGGATELQIDKVGTVVCAEGSGMVTVDKLQTIHQIENAGSTGCVSLHVYSKPFDSCIAFDLEKQRCYRRQLSYFSKDGRRV